MSNFGDDDPVGKLIFAIGNLGKHLRNLVYTKRIKNTKIVNPAVLMGLCGTLLLLMEKRMEIWGPDPVHASALAHSTMAERKAEEMDTSSVLNNAGLERDWGQNRQSQSQWPHRTGRWGNSDMHTIIPEVSYL